MQEQQPLRALVGDPRGEVGVAQLFEQRDRSGPVTEDQRVEQVRLALDLGRPLDGVIRFDACPSVDSAQDLLHRVVPGAALYAERGAFGQCGDRGPGPSTARRISGQLAPLWPERSRVLAGCLTGGAVTAHELRSQFVVPLGDGRLGDTDRALLTGLHIALHPAIIAPIRGRATARRARSWEDFAARRAARCCWHTRPRPWMPDADGDGTSSQPGER